MCEIVCFVNGTIIESLLVFMFDVWNDKDMCDFFLFKEKERDDKELSLKCEMCVWFGKWRYFL